MANSCLPSKAADDREKMRGLLVKVPCDTGRIQCRSQEPISVVWNPYDTLG